MSRQAVQPARHAHTARGRFLQIGGWVQNCLRAKSQYVKDKGCPRTRTAHTVLPPVQQAWPAWTKPRTPSGRPARCPRALTPEVQRSAKAA